jgi:PrcB C-terminal
MIAALLVALAVGADVEPAPPVKILATTDWKSFPNTPDLEAGKHVVARSAAELVKAIPIQEARGAAPEDVRKEVEAAFAKLLKVKSIDWKKQMLVVVTGGKCPQTDYRVEVTGARAKGKTLTVTWKLHAPKGPAGDAITYPATVALLPRHDGKVEFEQVKKK